MYTNFLKQTRTQRVSRSFLLFTCKIFYSLESNNTFIPKEMQETFCQNFIFHDFPRPDIFFSFSMVFHRKIACRNTNQYIKTIEQNNKILKMDVCQIIIRAMKKTSKTHPKQITALKYKDVSNNIA